MLVVCCRFFDGDYPTCAALIPMLSGSDIIFAKASFNGVISGAIYFVRDSSDCMT